MSAKYSSLVILMHSLAFTDLLGLRGMEFVTVVESGCSAIKFCSFVKH